MTLLRRYWFTFSSVKAYSTLRLGCGVTAYDYDDAVSILRQAVFVDDEAFIIERVIEDVDVSNLDPRHVIPNMDPPIWRGVWFPKGYHLPIN
jgi:hypothetical protein